MFDSQLLSVGPSKTLRAAPRANPSVPPDRADLLLVPSKAASIGPEAAVEMSIIHEQSFHGGIVQLPLHRGSHRWNCLLVQHLVSLNINAPISGALFQGQIGVPPENRIAHSFVLVPRRFYNANLRIVNALDASQRA